MKIVISFFLDVYIHTYTVYIYNIYDSLLMNKFSFVRLSVVVYTFSKVYALEE